jgi:hypothetical protein
MGSPVPVETRPLGGHHMSRKLLIPLVAVFLAAPAFAPAPLGVGLSAFAETSESTQKSNRMGGGPGKKAGSKTAPSAPPSKGQSTY